MSPKAAGELSVGVIGAGFGRAVHVPGFQAIPRARVVAIASRSLLRAQAVAEQYAIPKVATSWRDLVCDPEIDAVTVTTPPDTHSAIVTAAAECGKAILCEKPLALDGDQAAAVLHAARVAGVTHAIDFEFREVPHFRWLQELIADEYVGTLRQINVAWLVESAADDQSPWNWRDDVTRGGGVMAALGVHVLDYVEWLFGPVRRLCAQMASRITERPAPDVGSRRVTSEDGWGLLLELVSGVPVHVSISNVTRFGPGHSVEVFGSRGILRLANDNRDDYVHGFRMVGARAGDRSVSVLALPVRLQPPQTYGDGRLAPFVALASRFVDAALSGTQMIPSFEHGWRARVLQDLARVSAIERRWVEAEQSTGVRT